MWHKIGVTPIREIIESDSHKCWGEGGNWATIPVTSRPLLKSGLQPLGRYHNYQETISRRPQQMYTLSDTRLEWLGEGRF